MKCDDCEKNTATKHGKYFDLCRDCYLKHLRMRDELRSREAKQHEETHKSG